MIALTVYKLAPEEGTSVQVSRMTRSTATLGRMHIIRIPKGPTVAHLTVSKSSSGMIKSIFKVEGPMSKFMEQGEYETAEQAERAALAYADQRQAVCLIIHDRT